MKFLIAAVAGVLLLTGCQTSVPESVASSQTPPTASVKREVLRAAHRMGFRDRDIYGAQISSVVLLKPEKNIYAFCVSGFGRRYNYPARYGVSMRDGKILGYTLDDIRCQDSRLKYYPFPELDNLGRP
ncbi:hypothetical protein [Neorhizobium galegae]|uniref:hypothetical protein n=1 Tax=Neorhizobium galegae TaxID=399 RepID=UPI000621ECF7|nr:hypothetical protein [Neorhizobium galegae]CDZ27553.1 Hypothetical protein NGAL_HAMBI490_23990 [Neorhizobium galegae bv. officinalis]KAA9386557.1 hypothetical protein F4V88_08790 [Neorhizobium galegae]KAB1111048.1 hypothetical protein F4V89_21725 [Neorhizobium galegae]MCM2498545.1 hypothetical protein [Neorhizobium galegae]MCQ1772299.1 hypothetical protein [Neorhizobium galegae]